MQVIVNNITTEVEVQAGYELYEIHVEDYSAESAKNSAIAAALSASNALNSANVASTQAGVAATQAGIATTQAGIATTQASNALSSANAAAASATNALNSANAAAASAASAAQVGTSTLLTGFEAGTNTAIAATDSILAAFNKTQAQINARVSGTGTSGQVAFWNGATSQTGTINLTYTQSASDPTLNISGASSSTYRTVIGGVNSLVLLSDTARSIIGEQRNLDLFIRTNNLNRIAITSGGNVLINTTTDAGFRLDVNGTARVQGATTISATNALRVLGSTGDTNSGGFVYSGGIGGGNIVISSNIDQNNTVINAGTFGSRLELTSSSSVFSFSSAIVAGSSTLVNIFQVRAIRAETSGIRPSVLINNYLQPSSGNATFNSFHLNSSINATGTYSGIIRGLFYDPILTSLTGVTHRALQTTTGDVLLGTTSGSVGIGANTSINASAILDITSTTKGFLPPRMTTAQRDAIASPATGLQIFNITTTKTETYDGTTWQAHW